MPIDKNAHGPSSAGDAQSRNYADRPPRDPPRGFRGMAAPTSEIPPAGQTNFGEAEMPLRVPTAGEIGDGSVSTSRMDRLRRRY